ncbi:MAG: CotH kinase family protein, partial [Planctomycetota bacterium]
IVAGFVKDTRFSADRGFYDAPIVVEITTDTPGATIAYTTDGSEPTLSNGLQVAAPNASTPPTASVNVSTTTVLRARAYLAGWVETNVDTQTYLYLDDVVDQPASPSGFPSSWGGAPAVDYAMDPQVVNDPAYSQDLIDGLREIPTLSIVTPVEDLFGSGGLYSNTTDSNLEVVASAEWIEGDGSTGFQVDAGFKLQGGASRNPNNSPKHALSLRFRDSIADGKLEFPVYEDSPVTTFDSLHLRARYNNSWIHWSQQQRDSGTMIRDQWIRDSLLDMGQIDAGQGKYVHLYLNGLYWGLYVVEERAEAAHYAQYHGGDESEYDALNGSNVVDGDRRSFDSMKATVRSRDWNAIQQVLDVDNFIDFTIIQQFGSNNDIKTFQNWRGAGGGSANAPWRFYSWDSERVLEGVGEGVSNTTDPAEILNDLMQITEFRVRFADRVQQHFFNGGALTPESATQRLLERTDQLANAIVAESARWGDYRRDVHQRNCGCSLYTRDDHWQVEIDRLVEDYLPFRSEFVVDEYRSQGWFPNIDAAAFQIDGAAQHGGVIDAGALLSFDAEADVYYTLDGSDPRAEGGAPVGTRYRPGVDAPVELDSSTEVNARVRSGSTWSALNTTLFAVAPPPGSLAITELHYHPANNPSLPDEDDQEFIEILNVSNETVDLSGVQITQFAANPYVFANGLELAPNEYLVVARSPAAFRSVYGDEVNLAPDGYANRNLSNGGETIALVDGLDNELVRFTYDDAAPWPDSPDGDGPSLEMIDPLSDPSDPAHWRPSAIDGGSPGWSGEVGSGDFDSDGDVDGTDFLAWQRGFGSTTTADDLTAWEAGFGTTSDSATLVASQQQASAVAFSAATTTLEANQTGATSAEVIDLAISFWQSPEAFSNDLPPLSQVRASEIEPSDAARDQRRATYLPPQRDRWGARDPIATMHDDATLSERRSSVDDVFGSAGWSRISRRLTRSID